MFYQKEPKDELRFGDVITGLLYSTPNLDEPHMSIYDHQHNLNIAVPVYSVIITPCCSIREKTVSVIPLIQIPQQIFCTQAIEDDPLIINQPMKQEDSMHPSKYEKLTPEERTKELVYGHLNYFVYDESEHFTPYEVITRDGNVIHTRKYVIDFKDIYRINCKKIQSPKQSPIDLKRLELTAFTRRDLRNKISYYYGRATEEDKALLGE